MLKTVRKCINRPIWILECILLRRLEYWTEIVWLWYFTGWSLKCWLLWRVLFLTFMLGWDNRWFRDRNTRLIYIFIEILEDVLHFVNLLMVGFHLAFKLDHYLDCSSNYILHSNIFTNGILLSKVLCDKEQKMFEHWQMFVLFLIACQQLRHDLFHCCKWMAVMFLQNANWAWQLVLVFYTLLLEANAGDNLSKMILSFCTAEHFLVMAGIL